LDFLLHPTLLLLGNDIAHKKESPCPDQNRQDRGDGGVVGGVRWALTLYSAKILPRKKILGTAPTHRPQGNLVFFIC